MMTLLYRLWHDRFGHGPTRPWNKPVYYKRPDGEQYCAHCNQFHYEKGAWPR